MHIVYPVTYIGVCQHDLQVVELAPAYGLDDNIRKALHRDALKIARHVKYRNAGTVEFMVDKNGDYYFLEVNPRIQVGHLQTSLNMWHGCWSGRVRHGILHTLLLT